MHTFTGRFESLMFNYLGKGQKAVISLNEDARQAFEELKDKDIVSVTIGRYKKKRSLDMNSYYWVLVQKICEVIGLSKAECHNYMLRQYGKLERINDKGVPVYVPDTPEASKMVDNAMDYHLQPTTQVKTGKDGIPRRTYWLLRGSHSYNTEEMAHLIDGIIHECKYVGIPDSEIATPDEKRILKEKYGVKI